MEVIRDETKDFAVEVVEELSRKFAGNLRVALADVSATLNRAEINVRVIAKVGKTLKNSAAYSHQHSLIEIFDEIFADLTVSIYLAACGLDVPARASLRRGLELGVAAVYLWDLPHEYWAWRELDKDLSFSTMLNHIGSDSFRIFVARENRHFSASNHLINAAAAQKVFGTLSDAVHGKLSAFETGLANRFTFESADWQGHLKRVLEVETMLLELWEARFEQLSGALSEEFPQLGRFQRGANV